VQLLIANLATTPDTVGASISKYTYNPEGASGLICMSIHLCLYIFMYIYICYELVQLLIANLATITDTVGASISKYTYNPEGA